MLTTFLKNFIHAALNVDPEKENVGRYKIDWRRCGESRGAAGNVSVGRGTSRNFDVQEAGTRGRCIRTGFRGGAGRGSQCVGTGFRGWICLPVSYLDIIWKLVMRLVTWHIKRVTVCPDCNHVQRPVTLLFLVTPGHTVTRLLSSFPLWENIKFIEY